MKGKRLLILGAALALGLSACASSATLVRKTPLKTVGTPTNVTLTSGSYDTDHITWSVDDGAVTIQQTKGTSGTQVNSSYISAPRIYKGHILSFSAADGYAITNISITVNGTYFGNSMTAGTTVEDDVVTDNVATVSRSWTTTSGGTHVIDSVSENGLKNIYIQNVASATNTQLRISTLSVTYIEGNGGSGENQLSLSYTLDGSISETGSAYATANKSTQSGIDWYICGNIQQTPWRIGGKNLTNQNRSIYSQTAMPYDVAKIEISFGTAANIVVNSLNVGVYSTAAKALAGGNGDIANFTPSFAASTTLSIIKPSNSNSWEDCFYNITLNVTVANKNDNKFVQFIFAKFYEVENSAETHYTVSFNSLGGSVCEAISVKAGKTILDLPEPTKDKNQSNQTRYEFEGWYTVSDPNNPVFLEDNKFTSSTHVDNDLTLFANYNSIHYNIVSFNSNGGSVVENQEIDDNHKASRIVPSKPDYAFDGWYLTQDFQGSQFNFSSLITENITLYAKWKYTAIDLEGSFVKVTKLEDLINGGKYLIVFENGEKAFNGALSSLDSADNNVDVTFEGENIKNNGNVRSAYFTIDTTNGYIKSSSGYYIGASKYDNGLHTSTTPSETESNDIAFDEDGNVTISRTFSGEGEGPVTLKYNSADNANRFRYYKNGQNSIQLYRFVSSNPSVDYLVSATPIATIRGTQSGEGTNTVVDSLDLRFGIKIPMSDWNAIENIEDYGVMMFLSTANKLGTAPTVASRYNKNLDLDSQTLVSVGHRESGLAPDEDGNGNYNFTVKISIPNASYYDYYFCVRPFVQIDGEIYWLLQEDMHKSVRTMADGDNSGTNFTEEALDYLKTAQYNGGN